MFTLFNAWFSGRGRVRGCHSAVSIGWVLFPRFEIVYAAFHSYDILGATFPRRIEEVWKSWRRRLLVLKL